MDACMGYLREIDLLLEDYTDLTTYQDLFEAADDAVAATIDKNDKIAGKADSLLNKAINAVKAIINKIKSILSGIGEYFTASKGEREDFEAFCKRIKSDPAMKGKKVTIHDYREIMNQYDKILNKEEADYRAMKDEEVERRVTVGGVLDKELGKLKQKVTEIASSAGTFVAVEVAIEYARANRTNAAKLRRIIEHDEELLNRVEKELGKKGAKKVKRDIKILSSRCGILRKIIGGRNQQVYTLMDAVKDTFKVLDKSYGDGPKASAARLADDARKYAGKSAAGEVVKSAAKTAGSVGYQSYRYAKDTKKNILDERDMIDKDKAAVDKAISKGKEKKAKKIASKYMDTYNRRGWKTK